MWEREPSLSDSLKEAESTIEVYGDQLDRIAEMLGRALGKKVERRECSAALAGLLDDAPSWQDRPTGPGLWVCIGKPWHDGKMSDVVLMLTTEDLDRGAPFNTTRVYGPIPADETPTETQQ